MGFNNPIPALCNLKKGKVKKMNESTCFMRGQIWYWDDPIYGEKGTKQTAAIGEATLRYSRYCLIIGATDTLTQSGIMAIPCSSSMNTPYDVPIMVAKYFNEGYTYARCKELFPVHSRCLTRYVCTISDEDMKKIEGTLIHLLMPGVYDLIGKDTYQNTYGLEYDNIKYKPIAIDPDKIESTLIKFIKQHLAVGTDDDSVTAYELKDAYDQFCMIHRYDTNTDIVEFLDVFNKLLNGTTYQFINRSKFNVINYKGIRIVGNLDLNIELNNHSIIIDTDPQIIADDSNTNTTDSKAKWNDDTIMEFIKSYQEHGVEYVCEKFELKQSTANNYWYRWKNRLDNVTEKGEVAENANPVPLSESLVNIHVPPTTSIDRSISKLSNFIREYFVSMDLYSNENLKHADDMIVSECDRFDEREFYRIFGNALYHSLLYTLSITVKNGVAHMPILTESSQYLDTWYFLRRIYFDQRVSNAKNIGTLMELYKRYFPYKNTVTRDWMIYLNELLLEETKLNLSRTSIEMINCIIVDLLKM